MKRIVFAVLIVTIMVPALFAAGTQEAAVEPVKELRVMWWGSQKRHELTIAALELYAKENNVKITHEFAGWADYWTKLTTMAAGRNLPDVVQHDYAFLKEWQSRGLLQPLNRYVESGVLDFSQVSESALAGGRIDGELYGVNLGANSMCFVVDVDAFKKAGIPVPSDNWTWKEFEQIVMEIHEKLGIWGFGPILTDNQIWKSRYLSAGMQPFSSTGGGLGYSDDSILIDHLNMALRLQEAGAVPHISVEASDYSYGTNVEMRPLIVGKAAMEFCWSNQLSAMWTASGGPEKRNLGLVMIPRVRKDQSANYVKPSQFFSVTRDSANPELAAHFINFFTNSVEANKILMGERGVPIAAHVREALSELVTRPNQVIFDFMGRVGSDSFPVPPPDPKGWTDLLENTYKPIVRDGVLFGKYTPEEAVRIFREEAAKVLQ